MVNSENLENTISKLSELKTKQGFQNSTWDNWIKSILTPNTVSIKDTIEKELNDVTFDRFYDQWVKNFSLNLESIWDGHSARELMPNKKSIPKTSIVIGRGPSLLKNNHLEILANSNFTGPIICCDGALPTVLENNVDPKNFENFYVVTIDAQIHQKKIYEHEITKKFGKNIKCILSTTVPPSTYKAAIDAGMEVYWLHTLFDYDKGPSSFNHISGVMTRSKNHEKGLPAIQTGGNVGTSSWVISWSILKSNIVCLLGLDQGYPEDTDLKTINYHKLPKEMFEQSNLFEKAFPLIYNPEFNCKCRQDPIFQYYCNAFKEFIDTASKKVMTYNATEGGALFGKNIHCIKFKEFLLNYENHSLKSNC
jgi:hypothetical protein